MRQTGFTLTRKVIDALYCEALVLADEARDYFERSGGAVSPADAVTFSCESLKVTTRLMHSVAWLLNQKAYHSGELSAAELHAADRALGYTVASDPDAIGVLPAEARALIASSEELYYRLHRLAARMEARYRAPVPVHELRARIENAF